MGGSVANAGAKRGLPVLQGIRPFDRARLGPDVVAGVTLAALGIPEVMGYTKIAGMPVITGLYTILIPIAVFAVLGSSRHLVVGADSATAAIMAAGLAGLAPIASPQYVQLAGVLAILTAAFLLLARVVRLGFLADFLSRSVLIGFLTGVGIQVAMGQVAGIFGVPGGTTGGTIRKFFETLGQLGQTSWATFAVSASVLGVILILKLVDKRIPGALIAVVGAIAASYAFDLQAHGVAVLGTVPSGLPGFALPSGWNEWTTLLPTAASIFLVILAQSAATSRAYAAKYDERFDENLDLVGLYMPSCVLASIVFLIGVELVDIAGMRRVLRARLDEFIVAAITAFAVVAVGVEQGIILAIVLSVIDHLRVGYHPNDTYLVKTPSGGIKSIPVVESQPVEAAEGLVVYRFGANLYYANANRLIEEVRAIAAADTAVETVCIAMGAVGDVDYTGGEALRGLYHELGDRNVTLVLADVAPLVGERLTRYGLLDELGGNAVYETVQDVMDERTSMGGDRG